MEPKSYDKKCLFLCRLFPTDFHQEYTHCGASFGRFSHKINWTISIMELVLPNIVFNFVWAIEFGRNNKTAIMSVHI